MTIELLLKVISETEGRIAAAETEQEKYCWLVVNTYVLVYYVMSLCGVEGLLLDLLGLNQKWGLGGNKYITIALLGKIKGKTGDQVHLLPCFPVMLSGIKVEASVRRLLDFKACKGFTTGPAISNLQGRVFEPRAMNDALLKVLEDIFESHRDLFPPTITTRESLCQKYQAFRTLQRTSDTRALEMKVGQPDIDLVNRWKTVEKADGSRPARPMRQWYAEFALLLAPFLRYTWAM
jgi:hypothetical protein